MNKFIYRTVMLCLLASVVYTGCKYEKGPIISFTDKNKRVEGEWKIETVTVDGIDRKDDMDSLDIDSYYFTYYEDGERTYADLDIYNNSGSHTYLTAGNDSCSPLAYWTFSKGDKNKSLYLNALSGECGAKYDSLIIPLLIGLPENWDILKLTKEKMWLKLERDGKVYETHFVKKE